MEELSSIENKIYEIRGLKVMLDFDLATLYGVETKRLHEEYAYLRSQIATIEINGRGKHTKYMPKAFTEYGVAMLSSVLKSETAIQVNIAIMRAFTKTRQYLFSQITSTPEISELKKELKLLTEQIEEIHKDIESLNKDQVNNENLFDDLFNAFAKLSARIQSETTTLGRIRVKGFKK